MNPISWLSAVWHLRDNMEKVNEQIRTLSRTLHDRTDVHADIGWHGKADSCIIVVGRYRNRDYVQTFSVTADCLADLVEDLKRWEREYGQVRTLDAPPVFKAVFDRRDKF